MSGDTHNTVHSSTGTVIQARDISGSITANVRNGSDNDAPTNAPTVEGDGATFIYGGKTK